MISLLVKVSCLSHNRRKIASYFTLSNICYGLQLEVYLLTYHHPNQSCHLINFKSAGSVVSFSRSGYIVWNRHNYLNK